MLTANRVTTIFLMAATACLAACKGDPEPSKKPNLPPMGLPPLELPPDATAPQRAIPDGWLMVDPGANDPAQVSQAIAMLKPANNERATGAVKFTVTSDGLRVGLDLKGLTYLSKYTLRVHLLGDCSATDGSSAGPNFNFSGSSLSPPNSTDVGLLGEIQGDVSGEAKGDATIPGPELQGAYTIVGRALALHKPASGKQGDTGQILACGVIGVFADIGAPPKQQGTVTAP